jgi:two-component sensor histidine kinase
MAKPPHPRMSDAMQMWERSFPGAMEQAGQVRAALRPELEDCPAADEVVLLLSELSTNAVAHSSSGSSGGKFTVRFQHFPGRYIRGEVEDEGSGWGGSLRDSARDASGLFLVINFASAYGVDHETNGHRVVWFCISCALGDNGGRGVTP